MAPSGAGAPEKHPPKKQMPAEAHWPEKQRTPLARPAQLKASVIVVAAVDVVVAVLVEVVVIVDVDVLVAVDVVVGTEVDVEVVVEVKVEVDVDVDVHVRVKVDVVDDEVVGSVTVEVGIVVEAEKHAPCRQRPNPELIVQGRPSGTGTPLKQRERKQMPLVRQSPAMHGTPKGSSAVQVSTGATVDVTVEVTVVVTVDVVVAVVVEVDVVEVTVVVGGAKPQDPCVHTPGIKPKGHDVPSGRLGPAKHWLLKQIPEETHKPKKHCDPNRWPAQENTRDVLVVVTVVEVCVVVVDVTTEHNPSKQRPTIPFDTQEAPSTD